MPASIETAFSLTAHSPELLKRLKDNNPRTAEWWEDEERGKKLNRERLKFDRILRQAKADNCRVQVLIPTSPTPEGCFTGHLATYMALKEFCRGIAKQLPGKLLLKNVSLDHRASAFMQTFPMSHEEQETNQYWDTLSRYKHHRWLSPEYIQDHFEVFASYVDNLNLERECVRESSLYREMLSNNGLMEILRQAPKIIEKENTKVENNGDDGLSSGQMVVSQSHGVVLSTEVLCSVVLHAGELIAAKNDIGYCVIFCGGDMFDAIHSIRYNLEKYFGGRGQGTSPCKDLEENVVLVTTPRSEAVRLSSSAKPHNEDMSTASSRDRYPILELIRAGTERLNITLSEEQQQQHAREIEILLPEEKEGIIPLGPSNASTLTTIGKFSNLSGITTRAEVVIKALYSIGREKNGGDDKYALDAVSFSELFAEVGRPDTRDKDQEGPDPTKTTRKGLNTILTNLKELRVVREERDKMYLLCRRKIKVEYDLMKTMDE